MPSPARSTAAIARTTSPQPPHGLSSKPTPLKAVIVAKDELAEGTLAQDSQLEIPYYFTLPRIRHRANLPATSAAIFAPSLCRTPKPRASSRRSPKAPLIRVRYNPQDPDQNHTLAADNEGLFARRSLVHLIVRALTKNSRTHSLAFSSNIVNPQTGVLA